MTTTYATCLEDLRVRSNPIAARKISEWVTRPGYGEVAAFVLRFDHKHLFSITPDDVRSVIQESNHALGNVKSIEQLACIEDFSTLFAFQHLFHWYIEKNSKVPTWDDFLDWMIYGDAAEYWYHPLKSFLNEHHHADREKWPRAARWRLGKVYLSNIRELDFFVRVRSAGHHIKYHLLADVLFRVDFWINKILICTYFPNPKYRDGSAGRKCQPIDIFRSSEFSIIDIPILRQGFGNVWLATEESVNKLTEILNSYER